MELIQSILIKRDGMTSKEADDAVDECRDELMARLENGEMPFDICEEYFGLEPDYLMQLV